MPLQMSIMPLWVATMIHFKDVFCSWCKKPTTPDGRVKVTDSFGHVRFDCVVCHERSQKRELLTYCRWCGASGKLNRDIRRNGFCHNYVRACYNESESFRLRYQNLEGDELKRKMPEILAHRFDYIYRKNGITLSGVSESSE